MDEEASPSWEQLFRRNPSGMLEDIAVRIAALERVVFLYPTAAPPPDSQQPTPAPSPTPPPQPPSFPLPFASTASAAATSAGAGGSTSRPTTPPPVIEGGASSSSSSSVAASTAATSGESVSGSLRDARNGLEALRNTSAAVDEFLHLTCDDEDLAPIMGNNSIIPIGTGTVTATTAAATTTSNSTSSSSGGANVTSSQQLYIPSIGSPSDPAARGAIVHARAADAEATCSLLGEVDAAQQCGVMDVSSYILAKLGSASSSPTTDPSSNSNTNSTANTAGTRIMEVARVIAVHQEQVAECAALDCRLERLLETYSSCVQMITDLTLQYEQALTALSGH
ncbi:hypothetical protein Pelo_6138 [Pelomyxa schiedti]|nr:hypothetical protein Pelo_6138 [Pelomyxa schiedti]